MLKNTDWYLIRSSGVVALVLLTAVMGLGVAGVNRWRLGRLPKFVTAAIHRSLALLSVVFVAIHIVTTLIDPYAGVSVVAVVVPFAHARNAFWVGVGAVSLELILALVITSLLRRRLGYRAWRVTHWLAYLSWPTTFAHGIGMGTDASSLWFRAVAFGCLAAVIAAGGARLLFLRPGRRLEPQVAAS